MVTIFTQESKLHIGGLFDELRIREEAVSQGISLKLPLTNDLSLTELTILCEELFSHPRIRTQSCLLNIYHKARFLRTVIDVAYTGALSKSQMLKDRFWQDCLQPHT